MIFHFSVFLFALTFFLFLNWVIAESIALSWSWYLSVILPLVALSLGAARHLTGRFLAFYLPVVVSFSSVLLLSLIDFKYQQQVFILVGSIMYYFSLLALYRLHSAPDDQTARTMQNLAALGSLLFIYAGAYGLYLNFEVPLWLLMLVFFLATFAVSFQTLRGIDRERRHSILLASLILGIIFGEFVWLQHFWPFGYLTMGTLTLILFYWLWKVTMDILRKKFSQKQFLFESIVLFLLIVLLLSSAEWRMVV